MSPTRRKLVLAAALAAVLAGGVGVAAAAGGPAIAPAGDDDESPLAGDALQRASDVALKASRQYGEGGRVTSTEGADEEPNYEVAVTLADGTEIDFDIDAESFTVVGTPEVEGRDDEGRDDEGRDDEGRDDAPGQPDD